MSAGYANNPYVLNIVPLFGVAGSASGSAAADTVQGGGQSLAVNTIGSLDTGTVQFTSPVLLEVGGVIVQLQAKIAELEARIVALGG